MSNHLHSTPATRHRASPLVFVIPGVVTGSILVICVIVTLCVCARYRGWCPRVFQARRTRPQKQEIERIKNKIIEQYRRRKRKSRKNDVIPDVIDSTLICAICLDGYVSTISKRHRMLAQLTQCGHHFHFNCIFQWLDRNPSCPVCRTPVALSDDKIKAIGLQDVCCLDKALDIMPPVTHHDITIMTPTADSSPPSYLPSSGTPSPRLMAAYLLPSNSDPPSAPSVGTSSTFSTMSSVKSNTLDLNRVRPLPNPNMNDPQPSTSSATLLQTLNVSNLPKAPAPPPPVNTATSVVLDVAPVQQPHGSLPRPQSQVVVNVEINALASSFYNDSSSSDSSQSDACSNRNSTTSSSSFDSGNDLWIPDSSSLVRPSSDDYGSTTNIVAEASSTKSKARTHFGVDNPAFDFDSEQDFDSINHQNPLDPKRQYDLPEVHRESHQRNMNANLNPVNCSLNCDTTIQFSIIDENGEISTPEHFNNCVSSTPIKKLKEPQEYSSDRACDPNFLTASDEQSKDSVETRNCDDHDRQSDVYPSMAISLDTDEAILTGQRNGDHGDSCQGNRTMQSSELPSTNPSAGLSTSTATCDNLSVTVGNVPFVPRRTKSTGAHDLVSYNKSRHRPHSFDGVNIDSRGRPRVHSCSQATKTGKYRRNGDNTVNTSQGNTYDYVYPTNTVTDRLSASQGQNNTHESAPTSDNSGASNSATNSHGRDDSHHSAQNPHSPPKPPVRQHQIQRTSSISDRQMTQLSHNPTRHLPSRTPPSVSEHPEVSLHSSGSMPDFNRPTRNGRMWQSLSSSLSALSGASYIEQPLMSSTYM